MTAELGGFRANPDTTKKSWDEFVRCLPKTSPWRSSGSRIVAREHGLSVTGQGDTQSASALASETRTPATVPWVDVRTAQRQLKERGYYSGPVDGVIGRLDSPTVRSLTA